MLLASVFKIKSEAKLIQNCLETNTKRWSKHLGNPFKTFAVTQQKRVSDIIK